MVDDAPAPPPIDWEAFYRDYRKPGFVRGFEILQRLGSGSFGLVFKARKESIGKPYAIKFLKVDDDAVRHAVLRELDAIRWFAQIDHPNLVAIEDRGQVAGIPFIVMAYGGDETLRDRIGRGRLARDEALSLFVQVARGVQALHEHSLVHFDLKPSNVYLRGGVARVGDYGLAKVVTRSRQSLSSGRGTPHYMAPEVPRGHGDHRSDVYSLGILLYELLTGEPPFRGDNEWQVLRKHEEEAPRLPASLGDRCREVIDRCLQKSPADRYGSVKELLAALTAPAAPPRPAPTAHEPRPLAAPSSAPGRRCARGPRVAGMVFGVALAFLATVVFIVPLADSRRSRARSRAPRATVRINTYPPPARLVATQPRPIAPLVQRALRPFDDAHTELREVVAEVRRAIEEISAEVEAALVRYRAESSRECDDVGVTRSRARTGLPSPRRFDR